MKRNTIASIIVLVLIVLGSIFGNAKINQTINTVAVTADSLLIQLDRSFAAWQGFFRLVSEVTSDTVALVTPEQVQEIIEKAENGVDALEQLIDLIKGILSGDSGEAQVLRNRPMVLRKIMKELKIAEALVKR